MNIGTYERFCERQRARVRWRAAARAEYEARIVAAEQRARDALHLRATFIASVPPDCYSMALVHAERQLERTKSAKREAIHLQRSGGSAKTP